MKLMAEMDISQQIRERAYTLWQADGCPDGQAMDYWLAAEAEVTPVVATRAPSATKSGSAKTKGTKASAKTGRTKRTTSSTRKK